MSRNGLQGSAAIEEELRSVAGRERAQQQVLVGPHRDELAIRWGGHEVRRVASAGERKALGLLLLAAQGRILASGGRLPVYLLDDVDTELDRRRLESLWRVFGTSGQLFATSNRPQIWDRIQVAGRLRLTAGSVTVD